MSSTPETQPSSLKLPTILTWSVWHSLTVWWPSKELLKWYITTAVFLALVAIAA